MAGAEQVTVEELATDPHPVWHRLRAEAPVVWVPALDGWVVLSHPLASAVLRDSATFTVDDPRFSTGQLFGPSMLSTDGTEHDRFRAAFAREFRPGEIRAEFTSFVQTEVSRLLAIDGPAELRTTVAGPLAVAVMAKVLGLAQHDPAVLLDWYGHLVAGVNRLSTGQPAGPEALAAHAGLSEQLRGAFERQDALVGAGGLSLDEAVANAGILLFGGIETTEGMIALAVLHLLREPEQFAALVEDSSLADGAVEESLRLEPAATRVDRYAVRDVVLDGAEIAAGDLVIVSLAAADRDPAVFTDPDSFDLRRPNGHRNLALAAGPHYCLGAHLTRLQTREVLVQLASSYPQARLDVEASSEPYGLVFRKPDRVVVRW